MSFSLLGYSQVYGKSWKKYCFGVFKWFQAGKEKGVWFEMLEESKLELGIIFYYR